MLATVARAVTNSTRLVVLRHPNTMDCAVWRKRVTRVENDPETGLPSAMGGSPTLGGAGVLRSEDEDEYEYDRLGDAKCLFCGVHQPTDVNERDDALLQEIMQEAQVECVVDADNEGYFLVDVGDLVFVTPGLAVLLAYEVTGTTGTVNIPPYVRKLVLNPRDELDSLEPFTG